MNITKNNKLSAVLLSILLVFISACSQETAREAAEEVNVQRCIDKGGLPIRSLWDGRLVDCKFKPNEQKTN